jgi:hypothetical protein
MLEYKIRLVSEALARAMDRRTFLKRLSGTVAAGVSAMVLGPSLAAAGVKAGPGIEGGPSCAPPGPYCNIGTGILSGCRGGHCYQHGTSPNTVTCVVYYTFYGTGCWTTAVSGGNWVCCDCRCSNNATCGCAQFNPTGTGTSTEPSPH